MDQGGNKTMKQKIILFLFFFLALAFLSCNKTETKDDNQGASQHSDLGTQSSKSNDANTNSAYKIEFIELDSVKCIPCKKMQPILSSIEKKYGGQVKITFYDVCKYPVPAQKYGINIIPTQIFWDENGNELLRHEGFFPEEEIDKFLQSKGLKIVN